MIYLDNAATTMRKPPEVLAAVKNAYNTFGGPGRGSHGAAMRAADAMYACREAACELFGLSNPERVVLTLNATHALNIAIKSLAKPGRKVLVSGFEHNAVMRPLHVLQQRGVMFEVLDTPLFRPDAAVSAFENALDDSVCLAVCTHVSNVFGCILPVERIAKLCREKNVPLIIDASQSAGILPVNQSKLHGAAICASGHKGLYGPQGTGLLLVGDTALSSLIEGGTGSGSISLEMPKDLPDALEAGTPNAWGAAGLCEGIKFVLRKGTDEIEHIEHELLDHCAMLLHDIKGVKYYYYTPVQTGVMSMVFVSEEHDVEDIASKLSENGVAVRAGLQCAPIAHKTAGTLPYGTLRVSFSCFSTRSEVRTFAKTLESAMTANTSL
ncbi:MAG: aminotransferase class V-fold PLP-dependent enzyme [Oscillospiraceae bacterium]|nr:aminotransferase class V-fold PLP-dependent enzyme [Oscillospiraceae bacterium]